MRTISKVIVRDKNTLQIKETANEDDIIDLSTLTNVDLNTINLAIDEGTDKVYKERIAEVLKQEEAKRKSTIELVESKCSASIFELNKTIEILKKEKESSLKILKAEMAKEHANEINALKNTIMNLKRDTDSSIELALRKAEIDHQKEIQLLKDSFSKEMLETNNILREKEETILLLQRQKAMLNVKQTGEDLESWCNNEIVSYMQNGLPNCAWIKDNEVVINDGEAKGSKADYIFKIYATPKHKDEELLASICLEMKDENPDSKSKRTNSSYYATLDKNRLKKGCKYAVLISNLETDKPNVLPIFKVNDYQDMYVVRPAYMMTFLNMVTSLTTRFSEMILADNEHKIELQSSLELMTKFEELKNTYLDKPLDGLQKNIEELQKQNNYIVVASNKISLACNTIVNCYIQGIQTKLNNFEIKINREYKKVNGKINFDPGVSVIKEEGRA